MFDSAAADLSDSETLLRENQRLRHQIEANSQLMALLTHQLSTPLTSLQGWLDLLAEPNLDLSQRREFLSLVRQQVHHLHRLLTEVLALHYLDSESLGTHLESLRLAELLHEALELFPGAPIQTALSEGLPPIWGDRWQIVQVLANLLSNALKYSPEASPVLVGAEPQGDRQLKIWVRDYGLGIPAADQPHLFRSFYRVQHPDRAQIAGTGLGLALCKLLVENQGGTVAFESTHGEGSVFSFTLPVSALFPSTPRDEHHHP